MDGAPKKCAGVVQFNFEEMHRIAREVLGIRDPLASVEWVTKQFNDVIAFFNELQPDEYFIADANSVRVVEVNGYEYKILPVDVAMGCVLDGYMFCNGDKCGECAAQAAARIREGQECH